MKSIVNVSFLNIIQVDKEDFGILYWVFHQTTIPSLISAQRNGRVLHVDDFGDFR